MGMHKGLIGKSEWGGSVGDKTLADYLRRKNRQEAFNNVNEEKKLTFEEWFVNNVGYPQRMTAPDQRDIFYRCWKAAQENM